MRVLGRELERTAVQTSFFRSGRQFRRYELKRRVAKVAGEIVQILDGFEHFDAVFPEWQRQGKKVWLKVYINRFPGVDGELVITPRDVKVYLVISDDRPPVLDSHSNSDGVDDLPWRARVHGALLRVGFRQHELSLDGFDQAWAASRSGLRQARGDGDVQEGD